MVLGGPGRSQEVLAWSAWHGVPSMECRAWSAEHVVPACLGRCYDATRMPPRSYWDGTREKLAEPQELRTL